MQSALDDDMDLNEVLENLVHFGQHDWIPLWVIVQDAEDLVGVEDEDQILETTVALAHGLLLHGFRAGDGLWFAFAPELRIRPCPRSIN